MARPLRLDPDRPVAEGRLADREATEPSHELTVGLVRCASHIDAPSPAALAA